MKANDFIVENSVHRETVIQPVKISEEKNLLS